MRARSKLLLVTLATALGCTDAPMPSSSDEGSTGIGGIFTVSNNSGDDGGSSSSSGADESTTGVVNSLNCDKIDFVFVIDNSSSMADEQQYLVDAVPGFVDAMQTALPTVKSFRVGVVDTDTYPGLGTEATPLDGCPEGSDCSGCDYQLGGFLSKPASAADAGSSCAFATGESFMEGSSATFADEFACAAIVGTDGNPVEQQAGALLGAVDPANSSEGSCNAGFMRDDALLVFLMISDEEDDNTDAPPPQGGSAGEPMEWYESIIAAKNGRTGNVVALGLIGGSPRFPDCTALSANGKGAEQTSRLQKFFYAFDNHFEGSVCATGYDAFFNDALEKVAQGCMNFIP